MNKKIISLLMTFAIIVCIIPLSVFGGEKAEASCKSFDEVTQKIAELEKTEKYKVGAVWTYGQCWSFSNELSKELFGTGIGSQSSDKKSLVGGKYTAISATLSNVSSKEVIEVLKQAQPGDVIQYISYWIKSDGTKKQTLHACTVKSVSSTQIVIYEATSTDSVYHVGQRTVSFTNMNNFEGGYGFGKFDGASYGITVHRYNGLPMSSLVEYEYKINEETGEAEILYVKQNTGDILFVPSTIEGYPVTKISPLFFGNGQYLKEISVDSKNECFVSVNGVLFDKSKKTLIAYPGLKEGTSYTVPEGVTRIEEKAFAGALNLISFDLPSSLTSIGYNAFGGTGYAKNDSNYDMYDALYVDGWLVGLNYPFAKSVLLVQKGTVGIAEDACEDNTTLSKVYMYDGVKYINDHAFSGCTKLNDITMSDSVIEIGEWAFTECAIENLDFMPSTVKKIGNTAFWKCTSLVSANIPSSVTVIEEATFSECTNLKSVKISNSVTEIGERAFIGCTSLESVNIPGNVKKIKEWAFSGCTGLKKLNVLAGVTSIEGYAFYKCNSLSDISLPSTLVEIGHNFDETEFSKDKSNWEDYALYIGTNLIDVYSEEHKELDVFNVKEGTTCLAFAALSGNLTIETVNIPKSVVSISEFCDTSVVNAPCILNVSGEFVVDNENPNYTSDEGVLYNKEKSRLIVVPENISEEYTVPDFVKVIGHAAFSHNSKIKKLKIPSTVKEIGSYAFSDCNYLNSVTIETGITEIKEGTFSDCVRLESVVIASGVKSIGDWAFSECANLTNFIIPEGVESLGEYVFENCVVLKFVHVPSTLKNLKDSSFHAVWGSMEPADDGGYFLDEPKYVPTICCNAENTAVREYAEEHGIVFEICDGNHPLENIDDEYEPTFFEKITGTFRSFFEAISDFFEAILNFFRSLITF